MRVLRKFFNALLGLVVGLILIPILPIACAVLLWNDSD